MAARVIGASVRWMEQYGNAPTLEVHIDLGIPLVPRGERIWRYIEAANHRWVVAEAPVQPWIGKVQNHDAVGFVALDERRPPMGGSLGGTFMLANGGEVTSPGGWSSRAGQVNKHREELGLSDEVVDITWMHPGSTVGFAGHCTLPVAVAAIREFLPDVYLVRTIPYGDGEIVYTPSVAHDEVIKPGTAS